MPSDKLNVWLKKKRRQGMQSSVFAAAALISGGAVVCGMIYWVIFMFIKLVLIIAFHNLGYTQTFRVAIDLAASLIGLVAGGLIFVDSVKASRDDMSSIPLWLVREYIGIGPRLVREGWQYGSRFRCWKNLNVSICVDVLAFLATRDLPTPKREVLRIFPGLDWERLMAELRLIPGVLFFQPDRNRVTLTLPLRLEIRQLRIEARRARVRQPEPEPAPVFEPHKLSPVEILGVTSSASLAEIKLAYRTRIKECHPDRFARMDERSKAMAEEWTKSLNAAYETLLAQARGQR